MNRLHQDITCSVINQAESIDNNYPDNRWVDCAMCFSATGLYKHFIGPAGLKIHQSKSHTSSHPLPSPDVSEPSSPANAPDSTTNYPPPSNNRAATATSTSSSSYPSQPPIAQRSSSSSSSSLPRRPPPQLSRPQLSSSSSFNRPIRAGTIPTAAQRRRNVTVAPPATLPLPSTEPVPPPRPTVSPHHRLLRLKILSSTLCHSLSMTLWHKSTWISLLLLLLPLLLLHP